MFLLPWRGGKQVLMSEFFSNNTFVVASVHLLGYSNKAKFEGGVVYRREKVS
jgi:hypothetical protein